MDLCLPRDEIALQARARDFAQGVVRPRAAAIDRDEQYPWDIVKALAEAGFLGMTLPKTLGGQGRSFLDAVLVIEEMAKSCTVTARIVVETNMGAISTVMAYGSEAQKKLAARLVLAGDKPAICITEPDAGSDATAMTTRADRRGDVYVINGKKHWITGAGVSKLHLIFARVFDERGEELGIGGFLAVRDEAKGLRVTRREQTMGLRGMPEGELTFENLEVPADMAVLPPSGFRRGFADLMNAYNSQRVGAGTVAMGIAAGALDHALDWAKTREQFGRKIGEFQGLQWMLADMQTQLTAVRLMLYAAARSRGPDGSAFPDPMLAAQAKIFASESAIKIVNDALQFFGARGYSRDLPLERMARDVRMFTIGGGTAQVLRTLVASKMLGWKLPQTRDGYVPKPLDARRRGVDMHPIFVNAADGPTIPILFVNAATFDGVVHKIDDREQVYVRATGYEPKPGRHLVVPKSDGTLAGVLFGIEAADAPVKDLFRPGQLVTLLPPGTYRFANAPHDARLAALAFALGAYQFTRYRKAEARKVRLVVPDGVDGEDLTRIVEGVTLARDLINTPSNDMGPAELEEAARALAKQHGAKLAGHRRRGACQKFPAGCRGRRRLGEDAAADRHHLGQRIRPEDHAGRQGRVLRYRRPRHQERRRHAQHEEGHGRRRHRAWRLRT